MDLSQQTRVRTAPRGRRVFGAGALAGVLAAGLNLAIRVPVLALLDRHDVPFPLAPGAVVIFTFVPCLLGAADQK